MLRGCRASLAMPLLLLLPAMAAARASLAAQQVQPPYSVEEVRLLIASPITEERVGQLVTEGCIEFDLDAFVINDLRDAGATLALINLLRQVCVERATSGARADAPPGPTEPAVRRDEVAAVAIAPERILLEIGARASLSARMSTLDGTVVTDRTVSWSSSDPRAASVTADGLVTGRQPGLFAITAESEGVTGSAQVRVLPEERNVTAAFTTGLFLPGGGQFSVGRPGRGALTMLAVAGAVAWGYLATETVQYCASPVSGGSSCPPADVLREETERPRLLLGIASGAGVMLISAIDAALHGRRLNNEADRIRAQPWSGVEPSFGVGPHGVVQASWRLHVR